jgi:hypothetical protein
MTTFKRNPRPRLPGAGGQDSKSHTRRADHPVRAVSTSSTAVSNDRDGAPDSSCPKCRGPLGVRTSVNIYGKSLERHCLTCGWNRFIYGIETASMFHSTRELVRPNELNVASTVSA